MYRGTYSKFSFRYSAYLLIKLAKWTWLQGLYITVSFATTVGYIAWLADADIENENVWVSLTQPQRAKVHR